MLVTLCFLLTEERSPRGRRSFIFGICALMLWAGASWMWNVHANCVITWSVNPGSWFDWWFNQWKGSEPMLKQTPAPSVRQSQCQRVCWRFRSNPDSITSALLTKCGIKRISVSWGPLQHFLRNFESPWIQSEFVGFLFRFVFLKENPRP